MEIDDTGAERVVLDSDALRDVVVAALFEPAFDLLAPPDVLARSRFGSGSVLDVVVAFAEQVAHDWNL